MYFGYCICDRNYYRPKFISKVWENISTLLFVKSETRRIKVKAINTGQKVSFSGQNCPESMIKTKTLHLYKKEPKLSKLCQK